VFFRSISPSSLSKFSFINMQSLKRRDCNT
jgi:hypothetical protein